MEYKKVEKYARREETRQNNNLNKLTESVGIYLISETNVSKELKSNIEDNHLTNSVNKVLSNQSSAIEIVKDSNFDNEDEWDIDGIPELLNELDADIEKSLNNNKTSESNTQENVIEVRKNLSNEIKQAAHIYEKPKCSKSKTSLEQHFQKSVSITSKNKSASTFAGFSKGGHLISTASKSTFLYTTRLTESTCKQLSTKNITKKDFTFSMSSQNGNNANPNSNLSGVGVNSVSSGSGISNSNNSNKPNNKMSIDHQATLDKGLKMKIKRTKPGTKSSEAKHEIVKAIEQQQNGLTGDQDDISCVISVSNQIAANSQNSNMTLGINNTQINPNVTNNKKNVGSSTNQNNTCGNNPLGNSGSSNNIGSQSSVLGTKRGNSSHRRDKTKEKSSHSNRLGIEKNSSNITEKESTEKVMCHCIGTDGNISNCSNCSCNRKTETNALTQRLTTQNTSSNTSTVPPGVFTPSAESLTAGAAATLLTVTNAISTPISTQTTSSSINANAPGPPTKEGSNASGNIKISSHIAAQLAAAAASTNSSNGSSITSSTFPNSDIKSSSCNIQHQVSKQLPSGQISATVHHTLSVTPSINKSLTPTIADSNSPNFSSNEISESPPSKRVKQSDNNVAATSNSREMIDICIGTSVGTITEPECLGPCEPGTSVTLEGIVWHETEGGVLVVNVTWRGKTYVGTLLDCTRHDWAPPRFCDSPTEDLETRTPKGRGKRGRATITPDLSNFTETRSSIYFSHSHVHSKLRNGSNKSGRGSSRTTSVPPVEKNNCGSSVSSGNGALTPSSSPTAFLPPRAEKRKSKDESPPPLSRNNESSSAAAINTSGMTNTSSGGFTNQTQSFINPVTGLNVQINTKKCKTSSPCAISPVLLECPEQDCSKKYKHVNGLRYHQSHAHGTATLLDEDSMAETEEHVTPQPSPQSSTSTPSMTPNPSDILLNTQIISPQLENAESNTTKLNDENLPLQLENSEKDSTPETPSSLPGEDILPESNNTKTSLINASSSVSITSGTSLNETSKQFHDIVGNKITTPRPQETDNQLTPHSPTEKSGVLRFGQVESNTVSLSASILNETFPVVESAENASKFSESPEKCKEVEQGSNKDTYSNEVLEKTTQQHQNNNIGTCKGLSNSVASKTKKGRKSPTPTDYDSVDLSTCNNIPSREDVQSPAYSDISDDSAPINESDILGKGSISKNSEIVKKPQDVGLTPSPTCSSNPSNISSTLGGYGVYQFYQQQQFIVPSSEQQSSEKNPLTQNNTMMSPPSTQQNVSEFNAKKDPSIDLIVKGNSSQHCQEINKDSSRPMCVTSSQGNSEISNISSIGALTSTAPSKSSSHFYAFNYMPPNYTFNMDSNYGSSAEENIKQNRLTVMSSPNDQSQHASVLFKEDRSKEDSNPPEAGKSSNTQNSTKATTKSDSIVKSECIKQEAPLTQIPHQMPIQHKDHQGIGAYANMYQRHPLTLSSQQLSREEELRRYYIFSDQQRRQNSTAQNHANHNLQNSSQSANQQCKDDSTSSQGQHVVQNQHQIKIKSNTSLNINKSVATVGSSKESPKQKQDEEIKVIKQEGQKPTMETQGPPPPPTSQYFLHPSYITSAPFGFDPSHPMYRNVLMPASSPYNTPPYHIPMPRYHAPEDLSRNTGTKALDALHHAASQYYTTHKIHELSERALKSPNNNSSNNTSGTIKISGTSPNIGTSQHSNLCSNIITNHAVTNQTANVSQIQHNISTQGIAISNKQDISGQKAHGNSNSITGATLNEPQKSQVSVNSTNPCTGNVNNNGANNMSNVSTSDSRSPPPQRHVHTHHHTHVGLGYPMYPAPYGAAVLASQQAAAVAVINPFPPGPNK